MAMGLKDFDHRVRQAIRANDKSALLAVSSELRDAAAEMSPGCRAAAYDLAARAETEAGRLVFSMPAQATADREGYAVHVGCGGEVTTVRDYHLQTVGGTLTEVVDHYRHCHGCDLDVPAGEVMGPAE